MKAISLFSGMGGDSLGIVNAGLELVAYSEKEIKFRNTHQLNFSKCKLIGDGDILNTTDEELKEYEHQIDLIFAGFPCQGFSQAGKKLPDDPRNTLFREFLRTTKIVKPKFIIGENVKGLLTRKTKEDELFIDIIRREFMLLNYKLYIKVVKCNLHGIPQNRHRLIIVGIHNDYDNNSFAFPDEIDDPELNLKHIIEFNMKGTIKISDDDFDFCTIPEECIVTDLNDDTNLEENEPHPNLKLLSKQRDYVYKGVSYPKRLNFGKRIPVGGEIIDIRKPLNTIICSYARQPRFFVPIKNKNGNYLRTLLPDELKQIQGFPKNFKIYGNDKDQIVQIGNAVPPTLVEKIIKNIIMSQK